MKEAPFHLSLPCSSIAKTKEFYVDFIGAKLGRHSTQWLDIDLFGNQITFSRSGDFSFAFRSYKFEGTVLPSFHFGVIIDRETWGRLYEKLSGNGYDMTAEVTFLHNKKGQHSSFFIKDPNGHSLEFKCFKNQKGIFS
jgi:extradiol dioxygenase family protein